MFKANPSKCGECKVAIGEIVLIQRSLWDAPQARRLLIHPSQHACICRSAEPVPLPVVIVNTSGCGGNGV